MALGRTVRRVAWPVVALALLAALILGRGALDRITPGDSPSPTRSPASAGEGRRDLFILPDDGASVILDELAEADRTIDVTVYLLTADYVVDALGIAVERGVRVRVILEPDPYGGGGDVEADAAQLRALGAAVRFSGKDVRFNHIKTIVVDDRVALVSSVNLTGAGISGNRELGVVSTEPDVVATAAALFAADWAGEPFTDPSPLVVSPLNSRETAEGLIRSAERTIDVYAEVIRDEAVVGLLMDRSADGVAVRVIVPDEVAPDDAEVYAELGRSGVEVRTMGTPYQHAKMILVDGERALIGSINWTATSMDQNREAGIVVGDALSTARLAAVFAGDWARGRTVSE